MTELLTGIICKSRSATCTESTTFSFVEEFAVHSRSLAKGTIARLREWTANSSTKLNVVDSVQVALLDLQIIPVSSSVIRFLLAYGRVREAAICLGRPYALFGTVEKGFSRGKEMGVPTANLR